MIGKPLTHSLQRDQAAMDEEAAGLRIRQLRRANSGHGVNLALIVAGPALALAWVLLCLWVQSW